MTATTSGVCECYKVNGLNHGPRDKQDRQTKVDCPNHGFRKSSLCNSENKLEAYCGPDILYAENYVEIELKDGLNEGAAEHTTECYYVFIHNSIDYTSRSNLVYYYFLKHSLSVMLASLNLINARKYLTLVDVSKRNSISVWEKAVSNRVLYIPKLQFRMSNNLFSGDMWLCSLHNSYFQQLRFVATTNRKFVID